MQNRGFLPHRRGAPDSGVVLALFPSSPMVYSGFGVGVTVTYLSETQLLRD